MMTVQQIFDLGLAKAMAADPRGKKGVMEHLSRAKKEYEKMSPDDKKKFDPGKLTNPYADSTVHFDSKKKVTRVLAGIDVTEPEALLAAEMTRNGTPVDLLISHHPVGKGRALLGDVMDMGVDVYESYGVPIHLAEKIMEERVRLVNRSLHPSNHYKSVDVARLLGISFISTHTFTDNLVDNFLRQYLKKVNPRTVGDLYDSLMEIPEYQQAEKMGFGPRITIGSRNHRVGKWILEMTGGTEASSKVYELLSRAGLSTAVSMHMSEDHITKATEHNLNVVMAGHMSSDSLGMNLFLDELEKKGVEVVACGGLIRVSRNKKK